MKTDGVATCVSSVFLKVLLQFYKCHEVNSDVLRNLHRKFEESGVEEATDWIN